jgi:hypothetical protein
LATRTCILPLPQRVNDPTIQGGQLLWRWIDGAKIKSDPSNPSRELISYDAFRTHELSVVIASHARDSAQSIATRMGARIAQFTVQDARDAGLIIAYDPNDKAHGLIYRGDSPGDQLSKSQAKFLVSKTLLIV